MVEFRDRPCEGMTSVVIDVEVRKKNRSMTWLPGRGSATMLFDCSCRTLSGENPVWFQYKLVSITI